MASATTHDGRFPFGVVIVLAVLAFFAERQSVRLTPDTEITVAALPMLFAAVTLGPLPAMTVAGLGLLTDFRKPYLRWAILDVVSVLRGWSGWSRVPNRERPVVAATERYSSEWLLQRR